jgi:succinyl-diaminopimelate desuccinylase
MESVMYEVPSARIIEIAQTLVRIPSQSCIDDCEQIARYLIEFFALAKVKLHVIHDDDGNVLGIYAAKQFSDHGICVCLNACLDTAPVGAMENWSVGPFSGSIKEGWLYGRGSADSKIGASLFAALFLELVSNKDLRGTLYIYFDLDEHRRDFKDVKNFITEIGKKPDFVFIGYPGNTQICVGARGIYRINVTILGKAAHTGASERRGENAIEMMSSLVNRLAPIKYDDPSNCWLGAFPRITVTTIRGGQSFSIVPDCCMAGIDCRVTALQDSAWADGTIRGALRDVGVSEANYDIEVVSSYPAYSSCDSIYANVLQNAASKVFGRYIPKRIAGPSNIGNAISCLGIPSTCGFGVKGISVHGPDECANIEEVDKVYNSYRDALEAILL